MKRYVWNEEKNRQLLGERGVCFEDIVYYLERGDLLGTIPHPNQKIYVININEYVYLVPFVESEQQVFLKTVIPSRKATSPLFSQIPEEGIAARCSSQRVAACQAQKAGYPTKGHRRY